MSCVCTRVILIIIIFIPMGIIIAEGALDDMSKHYKCVEKLGEPTPMFEVILPEKCDNRYEPEPEVLTPREQSIENWLYRNCFEPGWGMTTPTTKQLAQMARELGL